MERQMTIFDEPEVYIRTTIPEADKMRGITLPKNPFEPKFFGSNYVPKFDEERLTGNIRKVFELMKDGHWRTLQEIEHFTRVPAASVSANLRHLKRDTYGSNGLEKRIRGDREGGLWEYKLIVNK